jgi:hypothetical protein
VTVHRHTWLFEPAIWVAEGRFWERGELEREGRGSSIIRHGSVGWQIEGTMTILGDPPAEFRNNYKVPVPRAGSRVVPWESHNPALGPLSGTFFIADDAIMSSFRSGDGKFVGSEQLTYLAADRYRAHGLFLAEGAIVSAWSMNLVRQE